MSLQTFIGAPQRVACNGLNRSTYTVGGGWTQDNTTDGGLAELAEFADSLTLDASATGPENLYRSAWTTTNTSLLSYTFSNLIPGKSYTVKFHFVSPVGSGIGEYTAEFKAVGATSETSGSIDIWDFFGAAANAGSTSLTVAPGATNQVVVTVDPVGADIALLCGVEIYLASGPDAVSLTRSDTAVDPDNTSLTRSDTAVDPGNTSLTRSDTAVDPDNTSLTRADTAVDPDNTSLTRSDTATPPDNVTL